ncbi:hypothetical protein [Infirmifilum sp. SLHALR2]|nr:MAG: hypothetical protein B7L53_00030 [Thermofilum sp. NZ13]
MEEGERLKSYLRLLTKLAGYSWKVLKTLFKIWFYLWIGGGVHGALALFALSRAEKGTVARAGWLFLEREGLLAALRQLDERAADLLVTKLEFSLMRAAIHARRGEMEQATVMLAKSLADGIPEDLFHVIAYAEPALTSALTSLGGALREELGKRGASRFLVENAPSRPGLALTLLVLSELPSLMPDAFKKRVDLSKVTDDGRALSYEKRFVDEWGKVVAASPVLARWIWAHEARGLLQKLGLKPIREEELRARLVAEVMLTRAVEAVLGMRGVVEGYIKRCQRSAPVPPELHERASLTLDPIMAELDAILGRTREPVTPADLKAFREKLEEARVELEKLIDWAVANGISLEALSELVDLRAMLEISDKLAAYALETPTSG